MAKHPEELIISAKNSPEKMSNAGVSRSTVVLCAIAAVIALAGLADATFLAVKHLTGESLACGESFGCSEVLGSAYASFRGIPLAAVGALAYFTAFSAATLAAFGYVRARTVLAVVVVGMFLVSLWLLYLQAFVLHAFCRYCLLSAAFTFALTGIVVALPARR